MLINISFIAVISGLVIALLTFLIFVYLLYRIYKFLFSNRTIFGISLKTRILSLGITSLFFPNGMKMIFIHPFRILFESLSYFYSGITSILTYHEVNAGDIISRFLSSTMNSLQSWFQFYNIGTIFLTLAAWTMIGQLIDSYNSTDNSKQNKSEYHVLRQNIILGLIFMLSIYMSLAAIITVPYFTETRENEPKEETLKTQLEQIKNTYIIKTFPSVTTTKPVFDPDSSIYKEFNKKGSSNFKQRMQNIYNEWKQYYIQDTLIRSEAIYELKQAKAQLEPKLTSEKDNILNEFTKNETELRAKLKTSYFASLKAYYTRFAESVFLTNDRIKSRVEQGDVDLKNKLLNFNQSFKSYIAQSYSADSSQSNYLDFFLPFSTFNSYRATDYYGYDNDYSYLPSVPVAGDELGIFKGLAQWLIKPSSMALVLIVGMLGFGLFGAVISTFVKETKNTEEYNKDNTIINDVPGVIIRGISAAIVIFLGVKGGLAIFSSGAGDPNPYALFFTCLVGAVYSERIWEWAKDKLTSTLNTTGTTKKDAAEAKKTKDELLKLLDEI